LSLQPLTIERSAPQDTAGAPALVTPNRTLRVGLYGAMANNMYCLATILRNRGYDATYVRDPADTYPMSQPLWEDAELTFDPERLTREHPSLEEWTKLEAQIGWDRPSWVVDPDDRAVPRRKKLARAARLAPHLNPRLYQQLRWYAGAHAGTIEQLRSFDWVIVTGLGVIAAYLSGRPYLYLPFGGDVTVTPSLTASAVDRFIGQGIRTAVRKAAAAGSADTTMNVCLRELGYRREPGWYQFLVDTDRYRPQGDDALGAFAQEVRDRAGGRLLLLMSSRQDFEWKASDRFLNAFIQTAKQSDQLFLVLTPWGLDLERAKRMLVEAGLERSFHVLPGLPSKPLLRRLFWASDVVVDQFAIGGFGTGALEAMACGRPVLMHIDQALFAHRLPEYLPPPVLQAASQDEIARVLFELASGETDLVAAGRRAREWLVEHHGPQHLPKFLPA
jgi:glycosyltransferase involved in cell wall biosynthesis